MKACVILALCSATALAADPWIMSTATNPAVLAVAPDVHSVHADGQYVYIESAGLSLHSFGALEANQYDAPLGPRALTFRIPRNPRPATGAHLSTPLGIVGVFVTGVPIYNPLGTISYRDQNLWHQDAVKSSQIAPSPLLAALTSHSERHSPIIGFALDGYPIYGPFGDEGRPMKSSYQLRAITRRNTLPDGTLLTPAQEGPDVSPQFPLGTFAEDYEYVPGSGDLDGFNGRVVDGTYAYFMTANAWPYLIGPRYYGEAALPSPARVRSYKCSGVELYTDVKEIHAGEPVQLTFSFNARFLEKVHQQPVHLVVVSKDLEDFDHIHPEPVPGDALSVAHTFAHAGEYSLYADYTAPGAAPAVAHFTLFVQPGKEIPAASPHDSGVQVTFSPERPIRAGEDIPITFKLSDSSGLEPWLGAWAHIMIVSGDRQNFIHAHPMEQPEVTQHVHTVQSFGRAPSIIRTVVGFKNPGPYKLWFQFQSQGEIVTVPFEFDVRQALPPVDSAASRPAKNAIPVKVSSQGFEPSRLLITANQQTQLAFTRTDAQNCASEVLLPELGIRKPLPPGQTVLIDLPASPAGELHFACGMGMFRGVLLVTDGKSTIRAHTRSPAEDDRASR